MSSTSTSGRNNWPSRKMRFTPYCWHLVISAVVYFAELCLAQFSEAVSGTSGPLEFRDILPEDPRSYDKMQPPKENGEATEVFFHVTVMSLDSIDEGSMTYAADIFFAQSWKDYRLRLPEGNLTTNNSTSGYRLLPVSWLEGIWRPDSFFKNAKKVTFQEMTVPNHYIWLHQDKTILYMVKLTLVLSCAMNFQRYPHDTQKCSIKIESLSYTTNDLRFQWEKITPLVVDSGIELPQFDIIDNVTGDCTQTYSTGNFTCLEVVFTFRRRLGYFLFHTYVPTCLIVIMSWISFWIKPEAVPARVTLGVTSLLTLSTQHANSQKSLPPVSYIKGIDFFMSSCTVFVFFSLMEYAVVNVVLGDLVDSDESYIKRATRNISRRVTTRRSRGTLSAQPSTEFPLSEIPEGALVNKAQQCFANGRLYQARQLEIQKSRDTAILIDRFSSIFFPVSFGILNLVYWGMFMEWFSWF